MKKICLIISVIFIFSILFTGCETMGLKKKEISQKEDVIKVFSPDEVGMNKKMLDEIDTIIEDAISTGSIPGAVIIVGRKGKIVKKQAYGYRALTPEKEAMTIDTLFDMASCSKPVGTASMTMKLYEDGKLNFTDLVSKYIPDYAGGENGDIKIENLLVHSSGLPAYTQVDKIKKEYPDLSPPDALIKHVSKLPEKYKTGEGYIYSCLNFLTLMRLNENVAGMYADKYLKEKVYGPLGMKDTTYEVSPQQKMRTAPTTEKPDKTFLRGEVHDPLANFYKVGPACSGNAGLFSTAEDLSIYARMLLSGGEFNGVRIFKPSTVNLLMTRQNPEKINVPRTYGWGISTEEPWSTELNRTKGNEVITHTGWTGTLVWMDKRTKTFIILLSNREHPPAKGVIGHVRSKCIDKVLRSIDDYNEYFKKNP